MLFVPDVGTSPMPSIEMVDASVVFHVSTTWSPAVTEEGEAVSVAVGEGVTGGAVATGTGGTFFLQPATANKAISTTTETTMRFRRYTKVSFRTNFERSRPSPPGDLFRQPDLRTYKSPGGADSALPPRSLRF